MNVSFAWDDGPAPAVATQSYREQATRIIRAQVVSGRLEPGSMYSIGEIAEKLDVSITPVREALHDLAKEGLLEMERNRGFCVRTPSGKELDDIVQVRTMLEVSAVREITDRGLIDDFGALRRLGRETEVFAAAGQLIDFLDADREFHLSVLTALDNPKLLEIVGTLRDQTRLFGRENVVGTADFLQSTEEHDLLLSAMEDGNSERAAEIMATHLGHIRGIWAGRAEADRHP